MKETILPCNGCTICCQGDAIYMHPELGDDTTLYDCELYNGRFILKHKENLDCIYLDRKKGCTIWERRPVICRELDCRSWLLIPNRKHFLQQGLITRKQLKKAKEMRDRMRIMRK